MPDMLEPIYNDPILNPESFSHAGWDFRFRSWIPSADNPHLIAFWFASKKEERMAICIVGGLPESYERGTRLTPGQLAWGQLPNEVQDHAHLKCLIDAAKDRLIKYVESQC